MTYKQTISDTLKKLAKMDDKILFVGYNTRIGKAGGTLNDIDEKQLIETPLAENLMAGMALGMAMQGYKPVLYFERFDFITNALDVIINHLDKIKEISKGEYNPTMIIRCVVGRSSKPFYTGITHTQDFTEMLFYGLDNVKVEMLITDDNISDRYTNAYNNLSKHSTILVEYQDLYDE